MFNLDSWLNSSKAYEDETGYDVYDDEDEDDCLEEDDDYDYCDENEEQAKSEGKR